MILLRLTIFKTTDTSDLVKKVTLAQKLVETKNI